jgi:hypothetical protein
MMRCAVWLRLFSFSDRQRNKASINKHFAATGAEVQRQLATVVIGGLFSFDSAHALSAAGALRMGLQKWKPTVAVTVRGVT